MGRHWGQVRFTFTLRKRFFTIHSSSVLSVSSCGLIFLSRAMVPGLWYFGLPWGDAGISADSESTKRRSVDGVGGANGRVGAMGNMPMVGFGSVAYSLRGKSGTLLLQRAWRVEGNWARVIQRKREGVPLSRSLVQMFPCSPSSAGARALSHGEAPAHGHEDCDLSGLGGHSGGCLRWGRRSSSF